MAETPYSPPPIQNRSRKPPGVLPKNLQDWVIGAIALVMVIVIAFSGDRVKQRREPSPPGSTAVDPNITRIQDYRARIERLAQKLSIEQARRAQSNQHRDRLPSALGGSALPDEQATDGFARYPSYQPRERERSWIDLDRERREYESRYASNVAHTRRQSPGSLSATPSAVLTDSSPSIGRAAPLPMNAIDAKESAKSYRLLEGTVIETVLTNRLDGSFSGPVNCMVTTNVYSHDRSKLLIPQGARVLGSVNRVETFGQQRLAVSFHRLLLPDGSSVSLEAVPGLNQVGETGLLDKVNRHYAQIFGVSLAIGAIAGLSQANTSYGADASTADAYRQGVASSLAQSSLSILDRYLNVLPTFTVREGHRVKVYLTGDILLAAVASTRSVDGRSE